MLNKIFKQVASQLTKCFNTNAANYYIVALQNAVINVILQQFYKHYRCPPMCLDC